MKLKDANSMVATIARGICGEPIAKQLQAICIVLQENLGIGPAMDEKFYEELQGTSLNREKVLPEAFEV